MRAELAPLMRHVLRRHLSRSLAFLCHEVLPEFSGKSVVEAFAAFRHHASVSQLLHLCDQAVVLASAFGRRAVVQETDSDADHVPGPRRTRPRPALQRTNLTPSGLAGAPAEGKLLSLESGKFSIKK